MGRYYDGDISGKFAFGVQSSNAASRFGVDPLEPNYVEYYFDKSNLKDLETELKKIEKKFGIYETPLLAYYKLFESKEAQHSFGNDCPTFKVWLETGEFPPMNHEQWAEFYDYTLGRQILDCLLKEGECSFNAEL